jgi:hypothetical protein
MPSTKASIEAQLQTLTAAVQDLSVEIRRLGAQAARRRTPRSRDTKDELLVLLLMTMFRDDAVQACDVIKHASASPELQQALEHVGAGNGRQLGRWFERVSSDTHGAHSVLKVGSNNRGAIWRILPQ